MSFSILPDDVPEDIESFYVIIYDVTLIGESMLDGMPGKLMTSDDRQKELLLKSYFLTNF